MAKLATKYKVPWKLIAKVNGIKPPYNIETTEIKLPPLNGHQLEERPKSPPGRQPERQPERRLKKMVESQIQKTAKPLTKQITEPPAKKRPPKRRI